MTLPNEAFLTKVSVDKTIKPVLDENVFWEKLGIPMMKVDSVIKIYHKETYVDFETPNDVALGRTVDPKQKAPGFRGEAGLFPHVGVSMPSEYTCRLYQQALEIDYSEEEMKLVDNINMVQRKTKKLANYFANDGNLILGGLLTENWSTTPSSVQEVEVASGKEWSAAITASDPIKDLLDAQEKIDDLGQYSYRATNALMSKQSYYDLQYYFAKNDYQYSFNKPEDAMGGMKAMGLNILPTNQVKRDFCMVCDFKNVGEIYQFEPLATNKYYTDADHMFHLQMYRTWAPAMTDPKACCLITNTA